MRFESLIIAFFVHSDGVYERDKQRLANLMAFGQDVEPATHSRPVRQVRQEEEEEEVDRFQECMSESFH
jgi:hypothetical protein